MKPGGKERKNVCLGDIVSLIFNKFCIFVEFIRLFKGNYYFKVVNL